MPNIPGPEAQSLDYLKRIAETLGTPLGAAGASPSSLPTPFARVWAPVVTNAQGVNSGAQRGGLRFMPRIAPGLRTETGVGYSLTLDPSVTVPTAVVGVSFNAGSDTFFLRPGETVEVPGGFDSAMVYAADGLNFFQPNPLDPANEGSADYPFGFVGFLVGRRAGVVPRVLPPRGPLVGLTAAYALEAPNWCTVGSGRFRLVFIPTDNFDQPVALNLADSWQVTYQAHFFVVANTTNAGAAAPPSVTTAFGAAIRDTGFELEGGLYRAGSRQLWSGNQNGGRIVQNYRVPRGAGYAWRVAQQQVEHFARAGATQIANAYVLVEAL